MQPMAIITIVLLFICGVIGPARLHGQDSPQAPLGGVHFTDVTVAAGLEGMSGGQTSSWADTNGDGAVDVMTPAGLFLNNGSGVFTRVEGVPGGEGVWGDVDNDGLPDFLCVDGAGTLLLNRGAAGFQAAPFPGNPGASRPRAAFADANADGFLDLYITNYEATFGGPIIADRFYLATGAATFADPTILSGRDCWAARGANWADFDNDGDQDLYVSNYRLMPNALWVNNGDGTFRDEAKTRGVYGDATAGSEPASSWYSAYEYTGHTIGSCWGDLNNDGNLDLVVVNFSHPPPFQNRVQVCLNSGPPSYTFHDTNKDAAAGIAWQESYAKGSLADADNDGDLDLYLTTVYPGDTGDLFENDGTGHFTAVGDVLGVRVKGSYQINWADVDNNGTMDLIVGGRLFRNEGNAGNWVDVRCRGGAGSNADAIGTRITVSGGGQTQIREICAGNSGNQDPLVAHIGLGSYTGPLTVTARFPSGKTLTRTGKTNTVMLLLERDA